MTSLDNAGRGAGPRIAARVLLPLQEFLRTEASGGIVLLVAALAALIWANSPADGSYVDLWNEVVGFDLGIFSAREDLQHWVNDGLMVIFFFVVGLEIKRELLHGELTDRRKAALPVAAALGGMLVPAAIFVALNAGGDGAKGWGIPMATDIAFAVGVLALLGNRIPSSLRVFLLALAIVDDIGAILVIAVFYTDSLQWDSLIIASVTVALLVAIQAVGVHSIIPYLLLGLVLWAAVYESGIHATIAGVALGLLWPSWTWKSTADASLEGTEHLLHPWSSFLVVPLFALANSGVDLGGGIITDAASSPVTLGVALGLLLGKPAGIIAATWIATRTRIARLPDGVTWTHIVGAGLVAGIGFTVSLFISELAFDRRDLIDEAKIGILCASIIAGAVGYTFLRATSRPPLIPSVPE